MNTPLRGIRPDETPFDVMALQARVKELETELANRAFLETDASERARQSGARVKALEAERDRLKTFAREVLDGYRTGEVGDIDGGWLQDRALELGLLVEGSGEDPNYHLSPLLSPEEAPQ